MPKYLITGSKGMLAYAIINNPFFKDHTAYDIDEFNIAEIEQMRLVLKKDNPEIVINCAAYTDVTQSELHYEKAYQVNALGVKNLAILSNECHFKLVHISTDFVFPGDQKIEKHEEDPVKAVNAYGLSKAEGEQFVLAIARNYLMLRISWLYGPNGKNFVSTISSLLRSKDELKIVSDQYGKTTYSIDVANALSSLLQKDVSGIVHFANEGVSSRYEFTLEICRLLQENEEINCNILPLLAKDYPDPTPRPFYSVLNTDHFSSITGLAIRHWKSALSDYIKHC